MVVQVAVNSVLEKDINPADVYLAKLFGLQTLVPIVCHKLNITNPSV